MAGVCVCFACDKYEETQQSGAYKWVRCINLCVCASEWEEKDKGKRKEKSSISNRMDNEWIFCLYLIYLEEMVRTK